MRRPGPSRPQSSRGRLHGSAASRSLGSLAADLEGRGSATTPAGSQMTAPPLFDEPARTENVLLYAQF